MRPAIAVTLTLCLWLSTAWAGAPDYPYEIIAEREHARELFTQGLVVHQGHFYESSGGYGRSQLVRYPLAPTPPGADFEQSYDLPPTTFAEGLALYKDHLYLLTWREQTLKVFQRSDLTLLRTHTYEGEGWGLTHDGERFIRSDGSAYLYFHEPSQFAPTGRVHVREGRHSVDRLNALAFWRGKVWANVWQSSRIVAIDPHTGQVVGQLDLSELVERMDQDDPNSVLNGIAPSDEGLWVTGKNWPRLFLLEVGTKPRGD